MIIAALVKELREKTGAGMMDCKKALTECAGDIAESIDWLRERDIAKAAKKSDRIAAEGPTRVGVEGNIGVIFEVNFETDFVVKNKQFLELLKTVKNALIVNEPVDLDAAPACTMDGETTTDLVTTTMAAIGEKISLRRMVAVEKTDDEVPASYMHMGGKISAPAVLRGADEKVAKDMVIQIASMNPQYVSRDDMPVEVVEYERKVQTGIVKNGERLASKPEKVLAGIIEGKVSKNLKDACLVGQESFLNPDQKVGQYLKEHASTVVSFIRYAVGKGIEKHEDNPAEEVMSQAFGKQDTLCALFLRKGNVSQYREADGCACDNIYKMEKNSILLFLFESLFFIIRAEGSHNPYTRKMIKVDVIIYKRVLLKLSGEALSSPGNSFDPKILASLAKELKQVHELGVDLAIVVGEGNFIRGKMTGTMGIEHVQADYMGMLVTVINALAVQSAPEQEGVPTCVQTAIEMQKAAESLIVRRVNHYLEKNRVVIFGAGTGDPYFSTDTTVALRASKIGANVIPIIENGVDGVYNVDPKTNPDAVKYDTPTYMDLIQEGLAAMDATATSMYMDNDIDLVVFNMNEHGNILKTIQGDIMGIVITKERK